MIQAALTNKKLDNNDSLPEMRKLLSIYSQTGGDLNFLKAIHVAGSKGKGSVCAFTEKILRDKGISTGMFTSPHLVHPRERIRINGKPVNEEIFANHVLQLNSKLQSRGDQISFFRFLWIVALDIFQSAGVQVGIIEVGMGGRFDATNVLDKPSVCGITSLVQEHVNILGPTLKEITWHKTGIIKPYVPIFSVKQCLHPETENLIKQEASNSSSPLEFVDPKQWLDKISTLGISGPHQQENAALACALASTWLAKCDLCINLSKNDLKTSLKSVKWPGRQQIYSVSDRLTLFLDGSHTYESVITTAHWFFKFANCDQVENENVLVFHCSPDRDFVKLLEPLIKISALFSRIFFMLPLSIHGDTQTIQDHHQVMAHYWKTETGQDASVIFSSNNVEFNGKYTNVLICGSLYLVGHFMNIYSIET